MQLEYKEILDWLNDVEQRASLMAQQWSEEGEEDEPKKKRKAVSLILTEYLNPVEYDRSTRPVHCFSPTRSILYKMLDFTPRPHGSPPGIHGAPIDSRVLLAPEGTTLSFIIKVPINPKFIFRLNKSFYNSEQNGANNFVFGQNHNFL